MHSSATPLPENRFQATGNNPRYRNAENDALVERYLGTVLRAERIKALADLVHHRTDQLPSLPLFYEVDYTLHADRVHGVTARGPRSTQTWNAQDWY